MPDEYSQLGNENEQDQKPSGAVNNTEKKTRNWEASREARYFLFGASTQGQSASTEVE